MENILKLAQKVAEEAEVIRKMIQWGLDGMSPGKIASRLTGEGVPTAAADDVAAGDGSAL